MTRRLKRQTISAFAGGFLFLGLHATFDALTPVAISIANDPFVTTENSIQTRVTGRKVRGCDPVPDSYVGWALQGPSYEEVAFDFPRDTTPDSSRPSGYGRQSFGLWRWFVDPTADQEVLMTMQHACGDRILTSVFGPFSYKAN